MTLNLEPQELNYIIDVLRRKRGTITNTNELEYCKKLVEILQGVLYSETIEEEESE